MSSPYDRRPGQTVASAGGKVILLGEHAVVYGAPALLAGVQRRVWARVISRPREGGASRLALGERTVYAADHEGSHTARAWASLLAAGARPVGVRAELDGDLPAGIGLGFSAAAGVALARAVELRGGRVDSEAVRARAMAWERVFHGNPSGADVAAAMHGGLLRFARRDGITPLDLHGSVELCIGLTGQASSTRQMVARVAELRARRPEHVDRIVDEIRGLVDDGIEALRLGDGIRLGGLFDRNQELLAALNVSSETIERMCVLAREAGGYGAKLTGAGGGGAVIALAGLWSDGHRDADVAARSDRVIRGWQALGMTAFSVPLSVPSPAHRSEELLDD